MSRRCSWTETETVDYVMGRMLPERARAFRSHCQTCDTCRSRLDYWQHMLLENELPTPPERLRHRLWQSLLSLQQKGGRYAHRFFVPLLGFVILLFVTAGLMKVNWPEGSDEWQIGEYEWQRLIEHPLAVRYQVEPVGEWNARGAVWIINDSDEMVLLLRGLPDPINKDYQAWLNKQDAFWDGGNHPFARRGRALVLSRHAGAGSRAYIDQFGTKGRKRVADRTASVSRLFEELSVCSGF